MSSSSSRPLPPDPSSVDECMLEHLRLQAAKHGPGCLFRVARASGNRAGFDVTMYHRFTLPGSPYAAATISYVPDTVRQRYAVLGSMPASSIRSLTPAQMQEIYNAHYDKAAIAINNALARELLFDHASLAREQFESNEESKRRRSLAHQGAQPWC